MYNSYCSLARALRAPWPRVLPPAHRSRPRAPCGDGRSPASVMPPRPQDLWSALEHPPRNCHVSIVRAERSDRWGGAEAERLKGLGGRALVLERAGHWVHVDNPAGLAHILVRGMVEWGSANAGRGS